MNSLEGKMAVVIGLGLSGQAASRLLVRRGARVQAVDAAGGPSLESAAAELRAMGVAVSLGCAELPPENFDLAVVSPGVPPSTTLYAQAVSRRIPIIGELELGYQQSRCLNISVTGTNGKTTTTELIDRLLEQAGRTARAAGNIGLPLCDLAEETRRLDFVVLEVSSFQLETIQYFRPAVAVLMNITPDHLDRYASMEDYARAKARIFENQQAFDWAIVQKEAFDLLKKQGVTIPSKVITFSSADRKADLFWDRGLLVSRLPDWPGPLFDMDQGHLRGPHNAENMMATLAVSRALRLPLDVATACLREYRPAAHRCELVAEIHGVRYVNDSKATNLDAVQKALETVGARAGANVILIAGGKDKGFEFHDLGPALSRHVKRAFLIGETREKIRAAWGLFTPCAMVDSLLEAVSEAAKTAVSGDVVLLSPACSSFDQFQNYQHRGEVFRKAVLDLMPAGGGTLSTLPGAHTTWPPELLSA